MSRDVLSLYQDVILDHSRRPRNRRALEGGRRASGHNPLCGDRVTVYLHVADDVIADATFEGTGCAICMASASLMTDAVKGLTLAGAEALCRRLFVLTAASPDAPIEVEAPLAVLAGVRRFPLRARCANLPWQTLRAAAQRHADVVSTE